MMVEMGGRVIALRWGESEGRRWGSTLSAGGGISLIGGSRSRLDGAGVLDSLTLVVRGAGAAVVGAQEDEQDEGERESLPYCR